MKMRRPSFPIGSRSCLWEGVSIVEEVVREEVVREEVIVEVTVQEV